jgi:hypothetical protein
MWIIQTSTDSDAVPIRCCPLILAVYIGVRLTPCALRRTQDALRRYEIQ